MLSWMVIYPGGDRSVIDIAEIRGYEKDEWALASFKEFKTEKEAAIYARQLSTVYGISLSSRNNANKFLHILDLEEE